MEFVPLAVCLGVTVYKNGERFFLIMYLHPVVFIYFRLDDSYFIFVDVNHPDVF